MCVCVHVYVGVYVCACVYVIEAKINSTLDIKKKML